MRTTVDLDGGLDRRLRQEARRRGLTLKEALNLLVAAGLASLAEQDKKPKRRFKVRSKDCGFQPGIDPTRINSLYLELEDRRLP